MLSCNCPSSKITLDGSYFVMRLIRKPRTIQLSLLYQPDLIFYTFISVTPCFQMVTKGVTPSSR